MVDISVYRDRVMHRRKMCGGLNQIRWTSAHLPTRMNKTTIFCLLSCVLHDSWTTLLKRDTMTCAYIPICLSLVSARLGSIQNAKQQWNAPVCGEYFIIKLNILNFMIFASSSSDEQTPYSCAQHWMVLQHCLQLHHRIAKLSNHCEHGRKSRLFKKKLMLRPFLKSGLRSAYSEKAEK